MSASKTPQNSYSAINANPKLTSDEILAEIYSKRWKFAKTRSPIDSIRSSLDAAVLSFNSNKGVGEEEGGGGGGRIV